ncbi:hypothetical protein ACNKF0_08060 [Nocardioides sp. T5]|uniref:hypothetical protein n=1 Tax=Nocardioides sp. T5 TaxID=3400182 RepID=UPI003A86D724
MSEGSSSDRAIPKSLSLRGAVGDQDVARLDVAVHDAVVVRLDEGVGGLAQQRRGLDGVHGAGAS